MKRDIPALMTLLLICASMLSCGGFWDSSSSGSGTSNAVLYVINNNGGDTGGVVPFRIKSSGESDNVALPGVVRRLYVPVGNTVQNGKPLATTKRLPWAAPGSESNLRVKAWVKPS